MKRIGKTMQELWQQVKAHLKELSPGLLLQLHPGVDEVTRIQMEHQLAVSLPEEVKAFFRLQNGSEGPLFGSWEFLSLAQIVHTWQQFKEQAVLFVSTQQIEDAPWYGWDETWLPLMRSAPSRWLFVRIDPKEEEPEMDRNDPWEENLLPWFRIPRERLGTLFISALQPAIQPFFVASSIGELLESLVASVERGEYRYDQNRQKLQPVLSPFPLTEIKPFTAEMPFGFAEEAVARSEQHETYGSYPGHCITAYQNGGDAAREEMQEIWQRLRTVLENLGPGLVERLRPGANKIELARVEKWFGFSFPDQVRAFFSGHNGSDGPIFENWELFSLEKMYEEHKIMEQLLPPGPFSERQDSSWYQWDASWLPLLGAGSSLRVAFNLQPLMWGEQEVVFLYSKDGTVPLPIIAASIPEFLKELVNSLEAGCYAYDMQTQHLHVVKSGSPLPL